MDIVITMMDYCDPIMDITKPTMDFVSQPWIIENPLCVFKYPLSGLEYT